MTAWLDENCGADGWAMTPSGMRGVLNDAVSIYFLDATLASAFVARWCAGYKVETAEGVADGCTDRRLMRGGELHREAEVADKFLLVGARFGDSSLTLRRPVHTCRGPCRRLIRPQSRAQSGSGRPDTVRARR